MQQGPPPGELTADGVGAAAQNGRDLPGGVALVVVEVEHRKAWLIRCTLNCTNTLLAAPWRKHLPLDEALTRAVPPEEREAYEAVLALPRPYRTAVHLYYVEGYSVAEVAALMGAKEGTVKSWLSRGRDRLARALKGDE